MSTFDTSDQQLIIDANLTLDTSTTGLDGPNGPDSPLYIIRGNTHPFRHLLRDLGCAWNANDRCWTSSDVDPAPALAQALRQDPDLVVKANKQLSEKPHYHGHRQRLRDRFMESGSNGLPDYELLELILFQCIPRIDVKPLAKQLIDTFGSLGGVLAADPSRLKQFEPLNPSAVVHLKALYQLSQRVAHDEIVRKPILGSWNKLITYLKTAMAYETREQFHILFLNAQNELIADEVQQVGTVNHTPVYPREVIKRALELSATALILVHNHPSGDPTPSGADIEMTKAVADAGEKLDIVLHDHIIVSKNGHSSFRDMGYL